MSESHVVVFIGPSMPLSDAKRIIDADYRPPVKRGDLLDIEPGTVVAIIDGVFEQNLSVSPAEVFDATKRGVVIFGGSSMGALRAVEVPGVTGIGQVFEWYRNEVITRDDEVALLFEPVSGRALTVPTVNVRFAVSRLCSLGTIDKALGASLVSAAKKLHFKERTYALILKTAGVDDTIDSQDLVAMLKAQDIKYRDAQAVLEAVDRHLHGNRKQQVNDIDAETAVGSMSAIGTEEEHCEQPAVISQDEILIWESGDRASYEELHEFLGFTGKLQKHARAVLARKTLDTNWRDTERSAITDSDAQKVFSDLVRRWGWLSSEEAKVSFADLGLDQQVVGEQCAKEVHSKQVINEFLRTGANSFCRAMRAELFMDDLALKRETMRLGSLRSFAMEAGSSPSDAETKEARTVLCKVNNQFQFAVLCQRWADMGLSDASKHDSIVAQLACARQSARKLVQAMTGCEKSLEIPSAASLKKFGLGPCPKPPGETRFCLPMNLARKQTQKIADIIGITRVGMIAELAGLNHVQIAQAARPGNAWSSSYGSGKSRTKRGAIVGSVMEEVEKWSQEQFQPEKSAIAGSYKELQKQICCINPLSLDLPYDTVYQENMKLRWYSGFDLIKGQEIYMPIDPLQIEQQKHDICFTARGARKHLATNGLGSGFSLEEAVLHGLCEYVERHAQRMSELFLSNPGGLGDHPYKFIDLATTSSTVQDLAAGLNNRFAMVRVLDITSDVRIPTFVASLFSDMQKAEGYGTHPDPNTAIEMALLEAAQTIASSIAGGREDLSIKARSLGRHERPRPVRESDAWFWMDPDPVYKCLEEVYGLTSSDVFEDLIWCLDRIRLAGVKNVVAVDLSVADIKPAHSVRIIIPGLETNNPFYTGRRARLVLLRDLLPKWH